MEIMHTFLIIENYNPLNLDCNLVCITLISVIQAKLINQEWFPVNHHNT